MTRWIAGALVLGWTTEALAGDTFQGRVDYRFTVSGEGAALAEAIMPKGMALYVRGADTRVELTGGMMQLPVALHLGKKHASYLIPGDGSAVQRFADPAEPEGGASAKKLEETVHIAGYECAKYFVTRADGTTATVWATDALELPQSAAAGGASPLHVSAGVPGMALRVEVAQEGFTIRIEAVEVERKKPSKSLFALPKGVDVVDAPQG